ncbi:hypothetical protein PIB30_017453 [Stylosanthes scabra]|uniref:Uncharacterized protein n=1 Tax=Stylosanthes scabra TaxID=79078 RepID=A0ABU6Y606_9FABA|nr:hypothetical protein [Stylosanthes scabra]
MMAEVLSPSECRDAAVVPSSTIEAAAVAVLESHHHSFNPCRHLWRNRGERERSGVVEREKGKIFLCHRRSLHRRLNPPPLPWNQVIGGSVSSLAGVSLAGIHPRERCRRH